MGRVSDDFDIEQLFADAHDRAERSREEEARRLRKEKERAEASSRRAEQAREEAAERTRQEARAREARLRDMPGWRRWATVHAFDISITVAIFAVLAGVVYVVWVLASGRDLNSAESGSSPSVVASPLTTSESAASAPEPRTSKSPEPSDSQETDRRCDPYVDCRVGDVGPGGGVVFYVASAKEGWGKYLEAAPSGWSGAGYDPSAEWCPLESRAWLRELATSRLIGTGRANSELIQRACGSATAAGRALEYSGGGKNDWFLPSSFELEALMNEDFLPMPNGVIYYWSSSQSPIDPAEAYWWYGDDYGDFAEVSVLKDQEVPFRPIRAF